MKTASENCNERIVESRDLLQGCVSVKIVHEGEVYILRITKSNKLILTK